MKLLKSPRSGAFACSLAGDGRLPSTCCGIVEIQHHHGSPCLGTGRRGDYTRCTSPPSHVVHRLPWIRSPSVCSPRRGMAHRLHSPRLASPGTWCGASKNVSRDGRVDSRRRGAACGLPPARSVRGIHPVGSGAPNLQPAPRLRCPRRASLRCGSGPRLLRIAGWGKVTGEREPKCQKRMARRI